MQKLISTLLIPTIALLGACSVSNPTTTPSTPTGVTQTVLPTTDTSALSSNQPQSITIWVTPTFHPDPATSAGTLLAERLAEFEQANPNISIDVRIKDENGPGGLLKTLVATTNAAPSALPDVITLNPSSLYISATEDLIIPLDELVEEPDSPEWYDHTLDVTHIDGILFGLPFTSEADVLVYKIDQYPSSPSTWADILAVPASFIFPASDPDAIFTFTQYLAHEGPTFDEDGQLTIDTTILGDVLTFYETAYSLNILPLGVHQYASTSDTWTALRNGLTASAVTSLSSFITEGDLETTFAIPLPTRDESGVCLAKTWSWAIVTRDPVRQNIAGQLLAWLTQPEFLGPWTHALGMLPPTKTSLSNWPEGVETAIASNLVTVAQPIPLDEILDIFGPPLHTAVDDVLNGATPSSAALAAAQAIQNP